MVNPNSGRNTSGMRNAVTACGIRYSEKYSTAAYRVPLMRSRLPVSESWLANRRCHSM